MLELRNVARSLLGGILLGIGVLQYSCALLDRNANTQSGEVAKSPTPYQDAPTVQFCDLLKSPLSYQSRVIKIHATLGRFRDYMTFYDPNCVPKHPLIKVVIPPSIKYETGSNSSEKLDQIISGSADAREGNVHVLVSAVGVFKHIPAEQRHDFTELQYEFAVTRIEKIGVHD